MFKLTMMTLTALSTIPCATSFAESRRSALQDVLALAGGFGVTVSCGRPCDAAAPFAPAAALFPAARFKVTLDSAVVLANELLDAPERTDRRQILEQLETMLLVPQNYTKGQQVDVPQQPAQSYLNAYSEYRNKVSLLERPGALLVQNGEIDTWKRLKRQEKRREEEDEIRAALNYYTSNINYDANKLVLTGTKEERSKLIRADRIPDVKDVVTSDMGLRYLLRNDILTSCDDARAELRYLLRQDDIGNADGSDLLDCLLSAQKATESWFNLIDECDAKIALGAVSKER